MTIKVPNNMSGIVWDLDSTPGALLQSTFPDPAMLDLPY